MILKKLKNFLGLERKGEKKEIIISVEPLEKRVALLEGGILEEFSIERDGDRSISGNIYKGRVHNIEKGLKALFVDIGIGKNAFLHFWDAMPAALDAEFERVERKVAAPGPSVSLTMIFLNCIRKVLMLLFKLQKARLAPKALALRQILVSQAVILY
jgi:Rne/Rng family ribonuclease